MRTYAIGALALALAAGAHAGEAAHGHEHAHGAQTSWGAAGDPAHVQRTVQIRMLDAMRFEPSQIAVKRGETVRFVVTNYGKLEHEFVLGTNESLDEHAAEMAHMSGMHMHRDEAWMVEVAPGKRREVVWTFNRDGTFMFACLVPGHYQAGMAGRITVAAPGSS